VDHITDDPADRAALSHRHQVAVAFTDAFLAAGGLDGALREDLAGEFTPAELAELALGVSLFHGFSKMLIVLGLEPEEMATTVAPTPDVA